MKKYVYGLIDDGEIFKIGAFADDEIDAERARMEIACGSSYRWDCLSNMPVADGADIRIGVASVNDAG